MKGRTFVGFGFGAIQAGLFLLEARRSGHFDRLVVAEIMPDVVDAVRAHGAFSVNIATASGIDQETVGPVEILNPNDPEDRRQLIDAIAEASAMATALPSVDFYARGPHSVAELLSDGLRRRMADETPGTCVVYTAENHNRAAECLAAAVYACMDTETAEYTRDTCGFLDTVIGKMSQVLTDAAQIDAIGLARTAPGLDRAFLVEAFNRILVSQCEIFPTPVGIDVFLPKADLYPFEEAKLYGHNATHALIGYLAQEKGLETMSAALDDPELRAFARDAFLSESGAALIPKYDGVDALFTSEGYAAYVEDLLVRMGNPYLEDRVERIIRDPMRKLGWHDRLIGTMRNALQAGIDPLRFAAAALAAIRIDAPSVSPETVGDLLRELWQGLPDTCEEADHVIACIQRAFTTQDAGVSTEALAGEALFIGLDLGTTTIKGVLTNAAGDLLAETVADSRLQQPRDGWVEIAAEQHYETVCGVIRELTAGAPGEIRAVAMAAASGNTLLTDEDGVPLTPIINWMDNRAGARLPKAIGALNAQDLARITGWPCVDTFPLSHLAWLRENDPVRFDSAAHYGMDTDWLLYRLTGQWRMDYSTASTFHLVDQVKGRYHKPLLDLLSIPEKKLSQLIPSGHSIGPVTEKAAQNTGLSVRTAIVAGSFDHPAAARAAGVTEQGQLMLSCGTSWVGFLPHADRDTLLDAELLCDPFLSAEGGPWAGMFSVPRIGRTIDWYIAHAIAHEEPDPMRVFNELAAEAEPGADGLVIDLREAPRLPSAGRANISRAVMEGAARLVNQKIVELKQHGLSFDRTVMVGGASRSPVWPGIVADITGLRISSAGRSAGACGAALLAAKGVGALRSTLAKPA